MSSQALTLRSAASTHEDGVVFARYMNVAADGGFRKMFGPRFEEIVATAFRHPNHDLSYEYALFAELDGAVVGMASAYSAEQYAHFREDILRESAGGSAVRIACILALIAPMWRFLHSYEDGDFYLQFLAVEQAHRGRGIGHALIQATEARGRECGATRFALDVSGRNPDARRLYERHGLQVHGRWPRLKLGPPAVLRMVKPL